MKLNVNIPAKKHAVVIKNNFCDIKNFIERKKYSKKTLLISDSNVAKLYLKVFSRELKKIGFKPVPFVIPAGERSKNLNEVKKIYHFAIKNGIDRKSVVFALGGGVVGDLTGFFASTYLRGIPFINVPTTLLADVDASLGGKTGLNLKEGKNLVGSFYHPDLIYININTLKTLSERIFIEGIAEVIKYGIILDRNFFNFLKENREKILKRDINILKKIVFKSLGYKKFVVERDEKEKNLRMILNFGHTFGHAIEAISKYKKFKHGEAVAIGMVIASKISNKLGFLKEEEVNEIEELIKSFNLPFNFKIKNLTEFVDVIFYDKKRREEKVNIVIPEKIGKVKIFPLTRKKLEKLLLVESEEMRG